MHALCVISLLTFECSASTAFSFVSNMICTQPSVSDRAALRRMPLMAATFTNRRKTYVDTSIMQKGSALKMQATPPKPMEKYKKEQVGVTIPSSSGPKVSWPSLQASQFRHPLDSQATLAIQRLFPFESVVRQSMGGMLEQMVYLDNMSNGIKVGNNQLPKIYKRFLVLSLFFLSVTCVHFLHSFNLLQSACWRQNQS